MLSVNKVTVCCENSKLLDDVTFYINPSETVGIVGASGSGKTILAHALLGYYPQGAEVRGVIDCCEDIALIPQSVACLNPSSRIFRQLKEMASSDVQYLNTLEHCQLDEAFLRKYPGELSGGMAKRALIAMGLAQGKPIIVADEPTSGLDSRSSEQLLSLLTSYTGTGESLVVISHDIVTLVKYVQRVLVFRQGCLIDDIKVKPGCFQSCHPYTQMLWHAAPENWNYQNGEEHYAQSA